MILLDTNVVVVYLTGYNEHGEFDRVRSLFEAGEDLYLPVIIVHELTHILPRVTAHSRTAIAEKLLGLMRQENFHVEEEERSVVFPALDLWGSTELDFADCLLLALARHGGDTIATLDARLQACADEGEGFSG